MKTTRRRFASHATMGANAEVKVGAKRVRERIMIGPNAQGRAEGGKGGGKVGGMPEARYNTTSNNGSRVVRHQGNKALAHLFKFPDLLILCGKCVGQHFHTAPLKLDRSIDQKTKIPVFFF